MQSGCPFSYLIVHILKRYNVKNVNKETKHKRYKDKSHNKNCFYDMT